MRIGTWCYVRDVGHVGHFPALGVGEQDAGMIEEQPGGTIEFGAGLLIRGHGGNERGFSLSQCCLILEDEGGGRSAERVLFLLGIERLVSKFHGRLRRFHGGAILLYRKLGVADLDANLVLELLNAHLRLAVFELGTNLRGLGDAVADGDAELEPHAFVGLGAVYELVESASVADRGYTAGGRATEQGSIRTTKVGGILRAPKARAAIVCEQIERRKQ